MVFAYRAGKHNMMWLVLSYLELPHANIIIKSALVNQHISVEGDISQPGACAACGLAFV